MHLVHKVTGEHNCGCDVVDFSSVEIFCRACMSIQYQSNDGGYDDLGSELAFLVLVRRLSLPRRRCMGPSC